MLVQNYKKVITVNLQHIKKLLYKQNEKIQNCKNDEDNIKV